MCRKCAESRDGQQMETNRSYQIVVSSLIAVNDFLPEEEHFAEFLVGGIALVRAEHSLNSANRAGKIGRLSTPERMPPSRAL